MHHLLDNTISLLCCTCLVLQVADCVKPCIIDIGTIVQCEKLGLPSARRPPGKLIWFCAHSVGELVLKFSANITRLELLTL